MAHYDEQKVVASEGAEPDIDRLAHAYEQTAADLGGWIDQQQDNYDTRHCFWAGQSRDQRKHSSQSSAAFPWEGASDMRTFTVDEIVKFYCDLWVGSLFKADIVSIPVEAQDVKRAKLVGTFMRWLIFSQMDEIRREAKMLANYVAERGAAVLGVFWKTETAKYMQDITVQSLEESNPEIARIIGDPEQAGEVADAFEQLFPGITRRKARKMATELRNNGAARFGTPQVIASRPQIRAFDLTEDLIIPINATDIQDCPFIFKVEFFTQEQLESKKLNDGWDEKWVDEVLERGPTSRTRSETINKENINEWERTYGVDTVENLYQAICCYYKEVDDEGIPAIYYTVFSPDFSTFENGDRAFALHDLLEYEPVRYPFVMFTREVLSRQLMETRGIPEIAKGWQNDIKFQRDSRNDRATFAGNPPREHPVGRKLTSFGPGVDIPVRRRGEYGFLEIPQFDPGSREIEDTIENSMRRYFGLSTPEGDPNEGRAIQQESVNWWLTGWRDAFRHVWALYQQYGPPEEYFRVVGISEPQHFVKGDTSEKYDFYIDFNVLNNDAEARKQELESIGQIIAQYDRAGQANWTELLRLMLSGYSPSVVDRLIEPESDATAREVKDTLDDFTKIWSGIDVDVPQGANAQLRQSLIQEWLQGSEQIPARDVQQRMASDESFRSRIEKYQKQLQFQIDQQQNAIIGRTGAAPSNMPEES